MTEPATRKKIQVISASDGRLGGYQGGLAMKRALLANEGVEVTARGRVVAPRLFHA